MFVRPKKQFVRTEHFPFKTCDVFSCPYCAKASARMKVKELIGKIDDFFYGSSPAPFVGRFGYPFVNIGILTPPEETAENAWRFDAPRFWAEQQLQIPEIVGYRAALVNSRFKSDVYGVKRSGGRSESKLLEVSQEVGMASRPVDMEISLAGKPSLRMNIEPHIAPTGPAAALKSVRLTSNPNVTVHVEKVVSDTDLKASEALAYLYSHGYDENFLTRLLSVGNLGLKTNRKLVPTRFSITATDDILGKRMITEIKGYNPYNDYSFYSGGYLGNYYIVLMFPEIWSYELFETLAGSSYYTTDYEPYQGRRSYVEETAGGYYAARLPILEKLIKLKRQASVLVIRVITDEYTVPLGVWVCRESIRKALDNKPIKFSSKELMLDYAKNFIGKKFNHAIDKIMKSSILLKNLKYQIKLSDYCK